MSIPYSRHYIDEDDIQSVIEVLRSDWLTTGPKVDEFETKISSFSSTNYATAVSSGTAALHAVMFAIGIGPGDEVILPAISFVSTSNAVVFQGASPVFCDVLPNSLLIDTNQIESKINNRTKAIVGVDYAGHPCDYSKLRSIADEHSIPLIIDACHSLGATYCGKRVGEFADLATYSFHPVKSITTGEGGMVITDSEYYDRKCKMFRNHGITQDYKNREGWYYEMHDLGYNYRISDLQCALGLSQFRKLPQWIDRRNAIAEIYSKQLHPLAQPLEVDDHVVSAYHLYVIKSPHRDFLFNGLREMGVRTNVHYLPIYLHPFYKHRTYAEPCRVAEECYRDVLSLPMFPSLSDSDLGKIIGYINELLENK